MRPVLFHLFGHPVHSYGALLGVSFALGWYLVLGLAERAGIERRDGARLFVVTAALALLASRALFVATNLGSYRSVGEMLRFTDAGHVAYGGFLGGFLGSAVACRLLGVRLLVWADSAVPALGTGLAFTRTGCFLNGCDFGRATTLPWAVSFPRGSIPFDAQVGAGLLSREARSSLPVHPTQLYEVAIGLALVAVLLGTRPRFPGWRLVVFAMGYGALRFLVEVFRADAGRGSVGPFSTSQAIALVTFVAAAGLGRLLHRRARPL